ncbi:MAG TPA: YegS/Rv2252/BmrU family lipid kinase [Streptosporangiaceae bacterium]|nr:YegS/Rv2252/BmrU family lipid kinase [Streptosporangiaceae bacterium]
MNSRFCLIVNPMAGNGRGRTQLPSVAAVLTEAGAEHQVIESQSLSHARELAATAAGRGEIVVAVGGDGMAGALAGPVSAAGGSYGVIPAGRGNDLATVLGVPKDPAAAARVLVGGTTRRIDLIGVSTAGQPESIVAGSVYAGLPALAGQVANDTKLIGGSLVYPLAALRVLAGWRPTVFGVRISGQQEPLEFSGYAVVVANSAYFGAGMRVAPSAAIDDGELDLVLMRHAPKLTFVRALLKISDGSHVTLRQITLHRGAEVTLTMDRDLPAAADGEALACASPLPAGTPLRIRVLPSALEVLIPAQ